MSVASPQARPAAPAAGRRRAAGPLVAVLIALAALLLAGKAGVHKAGVDGISTTLWALARAAAAVLVLFGSCGFGLVRLFLPARLRHHEPLWILPVGACAAALTMTVLGYAYVPMAVALPLTIAAGAALSVYALRRPGRSRPPLRAGWGWPVYVAGVLVCVALVPFFVAGFATVTGTGSDAHLAAGTGELLRGGTHPTGEDVTAPVDRVPLVWRSKPPIYYALGAVATLSGLETWEVLSPLTAIMFALGGVGFFLLARDVLGAGLVAGVAAIGVTGLDRMVMHTTIVPYYNQTWGYFTLPFSLVLAWWAVRERSRGAALLLALFLGLGALAYPLALPIPLLALAVFVALDLRARRREGRPLGLPRLAGGRRALLWIVPLALLLALPAAGVFEKAFTAAEVVLDPNASLRAWGGDLFGFFPAHQFFALPAAALFWPAAIAMAALAAFALSKVERPLAVGLGVTLVTFLAVAVLFRQRDYGWYFEFKTLAFIAPVALACVCAGAGRLGRAGLALTAALVVSAALSARPEVLEAGHSLLAETIELRSWADDLPPGSSVRLDIKPAEQLWAGYMLAARPVCSRRPLVGTNYPRVQYSFRADYLLITRSIERLAGGRPPDAIGPPLRENRTFRLYRARRDLPGPELCSQRTTESVTSIGI